jgi:hypothetical protein
MRHLQRQHILLFQLLNRQFLFLTRAQIERILTLPTNSTNKQLLWLVSERYLEKRYRADSFRHFQTPLYYLGLVGWRMAGNTTDSYKRYQTDIEQRAERQLDHLLAVYDVVLKFIMESKVGRIIIGEDKFWQEFLSFGNIPDAWIQYAGGEAFIEADQGTETLNVVAKKIENYIEFNESGRHRMLFPGCVFRVLVITTTDERIEGIERLTGSDDIWFATMDEFLRERLDHEHWFALRGFYALPAAPKKEM